MKTDDLIRALAADAPMRQMPLARAFALALLTGVAVSATLFLWKFGVRSDAEQSLSTVRFPLKFVMTLALTLPAIWGVWRLSRPDGRLGSLGWALLISPALLVLAVASELLVVPPELWGARLIGHNSSVCLVVVPLLALAPLVASIAALHYGAPTQPRLASIVAGLAAAGVAMTLYAANCPDDSPLFVATWYSAATAIVVGASWVATPLATRW